jgi:hypothetical protein
VRSALGIRANDAVWDVMIALDYHLQLYSAVPKQLAAEKDKLVRELGVLLESVGGRATGAPTTWASRGGGKSVAWPWRGQGALLVAGTQVAHPHRLPSARREARESRALPLETTDAFGLGPSKCGNRSSPRWSTRHVPPKRAFASVSGRSPRLLRYGWFASFVARANAS